MFVFSCCFVLISRIWCFLACCRTCNVLTLSQIISACSMSSEIHHVQLKFAFFLWIFLTVNEHLENPTIINLSRFGEFQKQTAYSIYLALKIFNFIPPNSTKWGKILDVNIHKTIYNKVVLAFSPTSRCLKEDISHKMCWIFHETLPIWLPIHCPLKNIVNASWIVLKICVRASKRWLWWFR